MKYKLCATTFAALALLLGYLAQAGFPTIVAVGAPAKQSAHATPPECASSVAVADRGTALPDVRAPLRAETLGLPVAAWFWDPTPMMGGGQQ
jgi:hypothetical protein